MHTGQPCPDCFAFVAARRERFEIPEFVKLTAKGKDCGERWVNMDRVREIRTSESLGYPAGGAVLVYRLGEREDGRGRFIGLDHVEVAETPKQVAALASLATAGR